MIEGGARWLACRLGAAAPVATFGASWCGQQIVGQRLRGLRRVDVDSDPHGARAQVGGAVGARAVAALDDVTLGGHECRDRVPQASRGVAAQLGR